MKIPVYIKTVGSKYIGDVDIERTDDFAEAAEKLWESQEYDCPILCHHCAEIDLGDWAVDEDGIDSYFEGKP